VVSNNKHPAAATRSSRRAAGTGPGCVAGPAAALGLFSIPQVLGMPGADKSGVSVTTPTARWLISIGATGYGLVASRYGKPGRRIPG
jgi:hypothetical protein